jgi:hypothetical protein
MRTPEAPPKASAFLSKGCQERKQTAGDKLVDLAEETCVGGLTKTQAEELLDWLEAHGCPHAILARDGGTGFAVRYRQPPGLHVRRGPGGKLRFAHL